MKRTSSFCFVLALMFSAFSLNAGGEAEGTDRGVTNIKFYGSGGEYNQLMVAAFEGNQSEIKVEIVPCDFANAEQIIKTGIASGNPVDVSFFGDLLLKPLLSMMVWL